MTITEKYSTPVPSLQQPFRILVIDDNVSIHDDFRKILMKTECARQGLEKLESMIFGVPKQRASANAFDIDFASQGQAGLEMVKRANAEERPYAMAFVDGRMPPGWDGVETIDHLWKQSPDLQVVLCTAYSDYSWQELRYVLGENDNLLILKKPFDNIEVLQLVHTLTRKWELIQKVACRIKDLDSLVRKKTEERNRTSALLEAAMKHSPAGIVISNEDGTGISWANPAAVRFFGSDTRLSITIERYASDADLEILQSNGRPYPKDETPLLRAVKRGEIVRDEEMILLKTDGEKEWFLINAAPICDASGARIAGIMILQDVTERKRFEKDRESLQIQLNQAQKIESIGQLAGGVAHDYNNMIGAIMGYADLGLMNLNDREPVYDILKNIKNTAMRSADLTRQLLTFARKQTRTPKVLDLREKVSGIIDMLQRLIGEDIEISWDADTAVWPVEIDPSQLDQVLINLCINARDAISKNGKIRIEMENATVENQETAALLDLPEGEYVMLTVTDNGKGMERGVKERIFEPFFTTKGGDNNGLGLATVYGIIKQNNGNILVQSRIDEGSAFTIYLPRNTEKAATKPDKSEKENSESRGEKVLLVEDGKDILAIGKIMLEKLGYKVLTAGSPCEALSIAEENGNDIDLLITDVVMPEMNGRDLAGRLTATYPDLKCLFMSGYTADIINENGIVEEEINFLEKPFSMKEFAAAVRTALYGKER